MNALIYRIAAADEDWAAIYQLLIEAFAYMDGRIDPPSSLHSMDQSSLEGHDGPVFVALDGSRVVGCAFGAVRGDVLYLGKIASAATHRGQGVARSLIDLARWEATRRGRHLLELESRVELVENHAAFGALGFHKTAETRHDGYDRTTSITMQMAVGDAPCPGFLRYASAEHDQQDAALRQMLRDSAWMMGVLQGARALGLRQWWIASGAIYNFVWNRLTGRPEARGIKDIDLIYWDDDLNWEAEDLVIKRAELAMRLSIPVEVRNQARVPLWYEKRFDAPYPAIRSADEALRYYASRNHAVAVSLSEDDEIEIIAPFGFDDLFSMRIAPNPVLPNGPTHQAKGERATAAWPEATLVPWGGAEAITPSGK